MIGIVMMAALQNHVKCGVLACLKSLLNAIHEYIM